MGLGTHPFVAGVTELAEGAYAWLAPDGSWGWSNAGLVVDGDESLLIDTLFDLRLTAEMLEAMRQIEPAATEHVDALVNTHANGDHCHGNELVPTNRIIASVAAAEEMDELPPAALAAMMALAADDDGVLGRYLQHAFGPFEFGGIVHTPPTETFTDTLELAVGDKTVELIEVGPAHTRGDVIVHVPADGVVYTGDILFIEGTPIMWAGPVDNWIAACDRIAALESPLIVPGHGPITDTAGVEAVADYWRLLRDGARERFDAGMSVVDAARDIDLGPFADWGEAERVVINVNTLYGEFGSDQVIGDIMAVFAEAGAIWESSDG